MNNFDGMIDILLIIFSIGFLISILMLDKESDKNAERIENTDDKLQQLVDSVNVHECHIDELYEVCTLLIAQNKEQAEQISRLEKKVKKLEKELRR